MAQRLEVEDLESTVGRPAKYPWGDWTDGTVWKAVQGEDYRKAETLKGSLRQHAVKNGLRVVIVEPLLEPGTVHFQFTKKSDR